MVNSRFKEISECLKKARAKAGLSQTEVANKLGYDSCQFISNWERGLAAPPLMMLGRLSKIYRIDSERLFKFMLRDTERQMRREYVRGGQH